MDGALRALAKGRRPSNTSTFFLRLAMLMAAEVPAGPAPITTASYPENPAPLPDVIRSPLSDRGAYTLPPPQCKQSRRRSWTALPACACSGPKSADLHGERWGPPQWAACHRSTCWLRKSDQRLLRGLPRPAICRPEH